MAKNADWSGRVGTLAVFLFSLWTFYYQTLRPAQLKVYVAPVVFYGRDDESDAFIVPLTMINEGASTGTVLKAELVVETVDSGAKDTSFKIFYSAYIGQNLRDTSQARRPFMPIPILGNGSVSETIIFKPQEVWRGPLVTEPGSFKFRLSLQTVAVNPLRWLLAVPENVYPAIPEAILEAKYVSPQDLQAGKLLPMNSKDWGTIKSGTN